MEKEKMCILLHKFIRSIEQKIPLFRRTGTGDLLVLLVTAVVIELGVRIVEDGPALRVLHSISVTLVVYFAAPTGQKVKQDKFLNGLDKVFLFLFVFMWSECEVE